MNRTDFHLWVLAMIGVLMSFAWGTAEDIDPRLKKVLNDWQNRQNAFRSVLYEVRGERIIPKVAYDVIASEVAGRKPPHRLSVPLEDLVGPVSLTLLLDFEKGRHRQEIREPKYQLNTGKLVPWVKENT